MVVGRTWKATVIQIVLVAGGWLAFGRGVAAAQTPPPAGAVPEQAPQLDQPPAIEEAIPAQVYSYQSAGRRDPFISLVGRGLDGGSAGERPLGLQGLTINEMTLRGIVLSRGEYLAVLEAPDSRTYIVRVSDSLFDGIVRAITADMVIFLQAVNDPLSLETEREVRRTLRTGEENR